MCCGTYTLNIHLKLFTLLQGTYPTSEVGWQEVAAFILWLHDGQGGRLRACLPAAGALNAKLKPKAQLVQQLKQAAGASIEALASKLDVLGLWKQLQFKARQVLLAGQPAQAAEQQQPQEEEEQQQQEEEEEQQQQPPPVSAEVALLTRAPGWETPAERASTLKATLKGEYTSARLTDTRPALPPSNC
jgi:hypothetical protein